MLGKITDHLKDRQGRPKFKTKDCNMESERISQFLKFFTQILFHNQLLDQVVGSVRKVLPIAIATMIGILINSVMIILDLEGICFIL